MVINQGEIYWADLSNATDSEPNDKRPVVIVQNNLFNHSRIGTVIVCALTSNLTRAKAPGNVLLAKAEANLSKASVVNVSQIFTLSKSDLTEKIGTLSAERFREIFSGLLLLLEPVEFL